MIDTRTLVAEAVAAVRIQPPAGFTWFGVAAARLSGRTTRTLSSQMVRDYLVDQVSTRLYVDFYRRGRAEPSHWNIGRRSAQQHDFEAALSAANCGRGYFDDGWRVRAIDKYGIMVVKNGLELTVTNDELTSPASVPAVDDRVALRLPKELFGVSPGFYMVCADHPMDPIRGRRLVRLYWNLRSDGAVPFVEAATRRLNTAEAAFNLKVLNNPGAFTRCDAGVVYVARDDYPALADLILAIHADIDGYLSPLTPVFTEELAPGLGFAEDPGTRRSFGEHRCRLLAEALVQADETGETDTTAVLTTVEKHFAEAGIDLDAAHLSPDPALVADPIADSPGGPAVDPAAELVGAS